MPTRTTRLVKPLAVCVSILAIASGPMVSAAPPDSTRIERLSASGRLWGAVKLFHPALAYRRVDWDSALVAAIPRIDAATDRGAYARAIQGMLDATGDSLTRVMPIDPAPPPPTIPGGPHPLWHFEPDSLLVVTMQRYTDLADYSAVVARLDSIAREVPAAHGVVFDLRSRTGPGTLSWIWPASGLDRALVTAPVTAPAARSRMHSGLVPPASLGTSGDYFSGWQIRDGRSFRPWPGVRARPIVFVFNDSTGLPEVALALQRGGFATLVSEGHPTDAMSVRSVNLELPDSLSVSLRLGELVDGDGRTGIAADTVVTAASGTDDPALRVARAWARSGRRPTAVRAPLPASSWVPRDSTYFTMPYPAREYRLLAAFRIWTYMEYFHAYRQLYDRDWTDVLEESIPRFEAARDSTEYSLAIAAMVREAHDTHAYINSPDLDDYRGFALAPVVVRMIEGRPVVTRVLPDSTARASGIAPGDVVLRVDGEDAGARVERLGRTFAASTPQSRDLQVCRAFLNGPDRSTATLVVRGASGRPRTVRLPRSTTYWRSLRDEREGDVVRLLPGNVGYADLDRLRPAEVDSMFERFRNTRGIIFDMRGYPYGTAWTIAPRLTDRKEPPAALFRRPVATVPHPLTRGVPPREGQVMEFTQTIPPTNSWRYHGSTVMLIDERTISQAEHTGLFFEAANGTRFVGTPTTGGNGDITGFLLPGGIRVLLSGQDVRHADGRQLQRVGLQPHLRVAPTIAGIRAGRDEVLEKAIEYLKSLEPRRPSR